MSFIIEGYKLANTQTIVKKCISKKARIHEIQRNFERRMHAGIDRDCEQVSR